MKRVPGILNLVSTRNRDLHSTDEKKVTKTYCLIGTSD